MSIKCSKQFFPKVGKSASLIEREAHVSDGGRESGSLGPQIGLAKIYRDACSVLSRREGVTCSNGKFKYSTKKEYNLTHQVVKELYLHFFTFCVGSSVQSCCYSSVVRDT